MTLDLVLQNDRFAEFMGIRVFDVSEGRAKAEIEISDEHLNGVNMVHGGVIFSLADMAFAAACNSKDISAVAASVSISFLNACYAGKLTATAEEVSKSRKLGTYQINVTDESGKPIACLQGTAYRK